MVWLWNRIEWRPLAKADLVTILQGDGPFTVFAPTNEAFLKAGIVVSTASKEELIPILLYHVLGD